MPFSSDFIVGFALFGFTIALATKLKMNAAKQYPATIKPLTRPKKTIKKLR